MELSFDMRREDVRPYFLWDTQMSSGELKQRLREAPEDERLLWIGRVMREARYPDVWEFVTLDDVLSRWEKLRGRLGRKNAFWEFLLGQWREHGLIPR
jgi:hypothetical protein